MSIRARSGFGLVALSLVIAACGGSGGNGGGPPAPVMTLAFASSPVSATEGEPIAPPVEVEVLADGVRDTTATNDITIALGSGAPVGATLGGTTTVAAVDGVATFGDLVISNGFGPGFTLVASATGFPSVESPFFPVLQAPATQLVITSVVPNPLSPFQAFDVTVELRTAGGVLQTSSTNPVTLALSGGGPDLFWHSSGNGTRVVELIDPSADTVVSPLPTGNSEIFGAFFDPAIGLLRAGDINSGFLIIDPATGDEARWANSNTLSDDMKSLVFDDSGVLHVGSPFQDDHFTVDLVSGVDTNVGLYTLSGFTVLGLNGFAKEPTTGTIYAVVRVTAGQTPRRLATLDPATGVLTDIGSLGDAFSQITFDPAGTLYGVTGDGATVPETLFQINPADATTTLDMTLGNGADGEVVAFVPRRLGGTLTVPAVGGIATFTNLHVDQLGTGYVVTASSPGLGSDSTPAFDVGGVVLASATVQFETALGTVGEVGGTAQLTLELSAAQAHNMPVFITIDPTSTATAGGATPDTMQPRAFQVIVPAGATTHAFDVPIVDDADVELDETLSFTIRSARLSTGVGLNATHVLTIQSDD
jgi:hypothetical protein